MPTMPDSTAFTLDLRLQGSWQALAAHLIPGADGHVLVDCGPESTLPRLKTAIQELGLEPGDVRHILLTHIHLDHAGAVGRLAREWGARVYVHARGAKHLLDPSRLLESATRIYGSRMQSLWGNIEPVPEVQLTVLEGGETIEVSGQRFQVLYTPGHAVHHVAFGWQRLVGIEVFAGDVAGVRLPGSTIPVPPTPPPDVNLETWSESVDALIRLAPRRLYLAHFGMVDDALEHLTKLRRNLVTVGSVSLNGVQTGQSHRWISLHLRAALGLPPVTGAGYRPASLSETDAAGLERYWRTQHPELFPGATW